MNKGTYSKAIKALSTCYQPAQTEPLDTNRIVEQSEPDGLCRSVFSRLFRAVNIQSGQIIPSINCRSWRCPVHRELWGKKWASIIAYQLDRTPCDLLVNLTTAEVGTTREEVEAALRNFMRAFRHIYGPTEYVKVTEASKKDKGRVHFHLLFVNPTLRAILPPKPEKWDNKLSFPDKLFHQIKKMWQAAMGFAAPHRKPTTVVWCQPPHNGGVQAASYALGYITGNRDKDEEPDHTWRGRKLTYSRGFFSKSTTMIWSQLMTERYGPPEANRYYWQPKPLLDFDRLRPGDEKSFNRIIKMPIMIARYKEAMFYLEHGHFPIDALPPALPKYEFIIEPGDGGQLELGLQLE